MNLTRILPLALSLALLAGCSGRDKPALSAEARTQLYETAIEDARDAETNDALPVLSDKADEQLPLYLDLMGLTPDDVDAFALSASLMNVRAYGIAAVRPVQGKTDAVREALQGYVDRQQSSFEFYLPDQYQVAQGARLETLEDGTVLLVMCQNGDAVFEAIRGELERA